MKFPIRLPNGRLKRAVLKDGMEWDDFVAMLRKKCGMKPDDDIVVLDIKDDAEIEDVDGGRTNASAAHRRARPAAHAPEPTPHLPDPAFARTRPQSWKGTRPWPSSSARSSKRWREAVTRPTPPGRRWARARASGTP